MDSRAAVFTQSPQSVEVYRAGTWWQGELLGWRHDASGACRMWVRVVVGGVEEAAWIDLAALRLPEKQAEPAIAPHRVDSRVAPELLPARAISAMRGRPLVADADTTAALPMVRDEVAAAGVPVRGVAAVAPTVSTPRPGGRRRAPEDAGIEVVAAAAGAVPPGRHRAARNEGRHRAADTDVVAVIVDEADRVAGATEGHSVAGESRRATRPHAGRPIPPARTARPEQSHGRPEVCAGRTEAEPDLLTRPMRLGDLSPGSRRPKVGGSVSGD